MLAQTEPPTEHQSAFSGDGKTCMGAILNNATMIGVCYTEAHADLLYKRLEGLVFNHMQSADSVLFEPALMALIGGKKRRANAKNKARPKPKRGKKQSKDVDQEEEEEENGEDDDEEEEEPEEPEEENEEGDEDDDDDIDSSEGLNEEPKPFPETLVCKHSW